MSIESFIKPELLVLIPVLYIIGMILKKSKMPDSFIPSALGIIAIILSALWILSTSDISTMKDVYCAFFVSVTQGVLSAGASVYINQIYIQSKKKE